MKHHPDQEFIESGQKCVPGLYYPLTRAYPKREGPTAGTKTESYAVKAEPLKAEA